MLFDELGNPWPIHDCWVKYKTQQNEAKRGVIEGRIKQLQTTSLSDFEFRNNYLIPSQLIEGFVIGFDLGKQIIPGPANTTDDFTYLQHLVFRGNDGAFYRLLVPKSYANAIEPFSYTIVQIESHVKGGASRHTHFVRSIQSKESNPDERSQHKLSIDFDYLSTLDLSWVSQNFQREKE